jgi:hypothetical protein
MAGKNENPVVETRSGKLRGKYEEGLYVFRGIPFATPPVGKPRWMPPAPVEPWSGVRPAEKFGPISLQPVMQMSFTGREPENEPQDEDCLVGIKRQIRPSAPRDSRHVVWCLSHDNLFRFNVLIVSPWVFPV